jgi:peptidoglycan biosynthesis protein MviN/MurJ (putative lipid II flippase)
MVSAYLLGRRIGGYGNQRILLTVGKTALAALIMGTVALGLEPILAQRFSGQFLWQEVALVGASALGWASSFPCHGSATPH